MKTKEQENELVSEVYFYKRRLQAYLQTMVDISLELEDEKLQNKLMDIAGLVNRL